MKKKIFGGIAIVAIAVAVALNVNMVTVKSNNALTAANVEALAMDTMDSPTMTDDEFTQATGCVATQNNVKCKTGNTTYTFAYRP